MTMHNVNYEHDIGGGRRAVLTMGWRCRRGQCGVDSRFWSAPAFRPCGWQLGRVVEVKLRLTVLCLVAAEGLEAGDATVNEHNIYWSNSRTSSSINKSSNSRTAQLFHKHDTSLYSS